MGRFDDKVAFITGGARGMGRSHAVALAREGADVAFCDVAAPGEAGEGARTAPYPLADVEGAAETVRLVEAEGRRCLALAADIRDTEQIEGAVARAIEELGRVDFLIANAGICTFAPFEQITDAMWEEMIAVNLTGAFKSMRAVVPHMVERGEGRIVAIASTAARTGAPNLAHYAASKWGLVGLTKSLALELAAKGVTVNAVCPATVNTPMVHNEALYGLFAPDVKQPTREEVAPRYAALNPIPRPWLEPEEVTAAVLYLLGEEARGVTGATLEVGLGSSARTP